MSTELSQAELEEMMVGKNQTPTVVFYEKARINTEASKKANRRIYQTLTYIKEKQAGVTDWIPQIAKKHHIEAYPYEYQDFLNNKNGLKSPSLDIIPNITPAELQELLDFGLRNIKQLAEADFVPPHLSHVQKSAMILQSVLTEQDNVQEESHEESSIETTRSIPEGRTTQSSYESYGGETKDVPEAGGRQHSDDLGQCLVPDSIAESERKTTERIQARRCIDDSKNLSSNWSLSFGG